MKHPPSDFPRAYEVALRLHLGDGSRAVPLLIKQTGGQMRTSRFPLPDFAKLHENLLVMGLLPACTPRKRPALIRDAGNFFAAVIGTAGTGKAGAHGEARLDKAIQSLSGCTVELASAKRLLGLEIIQRKKAETSLRKNEQHVMESLGKCELLKKQLRGLSRRILTAQEDERKKISRELHEVVAQALVGINIRLSALRVETAGINTKGLGRRISRTQKMITKSSNIVLQFAHELRPSALDDLGLIPALHSFMKNLTTRTGVRTYLAAFPGVEKLSTAKRTVLYRVAQEALTNVSRHAKASRVDVTIRKDAKFVFMTVTDDGKTFQAGRALLTAGAKHLGLLGMRERLEMVGGSFEIESAPRTGTKIAARIPVSKATEKRWREDSANTEPEKP